MYLSTGRFDDAEEQESYREELQAVARRIEAGTPPEFDPSELERLRAQRQLVEAVPATAAYGTLVRLFLPAVLLVGGLYALLYVLRRFVQ